MLNNFIYSETKGLFLEQLDQKNIPEEAIAFLEDSGEIGNRNHYFGSVGVNNLLTEGKLIGTITANNNPYNIYAPKTYNWSEITGKPTTLAGYGITNAMRVSDAIDTSTMVNAAGYGYVAQGWQAGGPAMTFGVSHVYKALLQCPYGLNGLYWKFTYQEEDTNWRKLLDDNNYAVTLDSAYLKLSGGMINTEDIAGLTIYRNNSKYSMIHFCNNVGNGLVDVGYLGVVGEGVPVYLNSGGSQFNLLHAGNFNSYAPTLTGTGASGTWGIDISGSAAGFSLYPSSPNNAPDNKFFTGGFKSEGTPATNYATGFTLKNTDLAWTFQLSFDSNAGLYTRRRGSSDWDAWKTVAFTDSVVAGANKLVTTSGTAVALAENDGVVFPYFSSSLISGIDSVGVHIKRNGSNPLASGGLAITNFENKGAILFGGASGLLVYNYVNDAYSSVFRINNYGNVTIGPSDLAGTNYKLHVDGKLRAQLINIEGGNEINGVDNNGGAAALCLNWSSAGNVILAYGGGNVGIGTTNANAKLAVNGTANIFSRLLVNGATDDEITALQVNGDIVIPNYTAYKACDTNGGKMNLMYLDTSNRLRVYNDTMSFTPQAKVGIGTPTPQEKLHVVGNLYVTGNIIADGQVSSGGIEIDPATISTQISQLTATIEGLQSTVKLLQDELNSLK